MSNSIKRILQICDESEAVIVSYGLAPNPFGFCFEQGEDMTKAQARELDRLLESLSERDERKLRAIIFGGES